MRTKSHAVAASALKGITDTAVRGFVGFFFDDHSKTRPHQGGIHHKREVDIAIPAEGVILRVDLICGWEGRGPEP